MVASVVTIDDDRAVLITVSGCLQKAGYEVLQAVSPEKGLQMIKDSNPSVAIIDVMMPELNGFELFKKIRTFNPSIPILFLSSETNTDSIGLAARLGAFCFLPKPVDAKQLVNAVDRARAISESHEHFPESYEKESSDRKRELDPLNLLQEFNHTKGYGSVGLN